MPEVLRAILGQSTILAVKKFHLILAVHSAVMHRLGFYLVEGKAARERTGCRHYMPRPFETTYH